MTKLTIATVAFFKAAGVFRVRSDEKARERFDEALDDFVENHPETDDDKTPDELFAALIEHREQEKRDKVAAEIAKAERKAERERVKEEKAAKLAEMPIATGFTSLDEKISRLEPGAYVLSAAQNNTFVDEKALDAILNFCRVNGAKLLIGAMTYNKNMFAKTDDDDIWYAQALRPYIVTGQIDIGGYHFLADANVIPTATWPTSGFDGNTPAGVGAIIPASKIELRVSAAGKNAKTKTIAATGCLTQRNYILRKTGAKAAAAHCIGAVYVNTLTGEIRHLEMMPDSDCIYDTTGIYYANGDYSPLQRGDVAAFQPGDIHAEKMDAANLREVCHMIAHFQPLNVLAHDLLDFSSRNHHNIKDPFFLQEQYRAGNTVRGDLEAMASVLDTLAIASTATTHVVESNHDLAIDTWLKSTDWRGDPINAETYLDLALAKIKGDKSFNTLAYAYETIGGGMERNNIVFHKTDEDLMIAGVDMGNHGHNGANGSRGSPKQFAALGVPMNTGHTHSPSIYGRVYTAGVTASLDMDYNIGASSWAIAHIITYANGQRQILFA